MYVLQCHIYDASIEAPCFELMNYDAGIVITTLGVRHQLCGKNYDASVVKYDHNGFYNTDHESQIDQICFEKWKETFFEKHTLKNIL